MTRCAKGARAPADGDSVPRRLRATVAATAVVLAAFAAALAPAAPQVLPGQPLASAAAATTGSLTVTPNKYLPGQALRFQGNLGITGVRPIHLEAHLGRPGDRWGDLIGGPVFRTDARGNFDFLFRAPAMINLSYRVAGGGRVTNAHLFHANQQELTLTPPKASPDYPFYRVRAGADFTVVVDTTPEIRTTFGTPPAIPGRTVRLQERDSATEWRTIATGTTDQEGKALFTVRAPSSGTLVLRARQDAWTEGANQIGWFASFPAYFDVSGATGADLPATTPVGPVHTVLRSPARPTASERFKWGPAQWDYAWEAGQSLDAPPARGTVLEGTWQAGSDGTGRVTPFNGGLVLQSKFKKTGPGDRGTTTATLQGTSQEHGRWEFRLQGRPWEKGARPYVYRVELVPVGTRHGICSPESIVVAEFTITRPGMRFGIRSTKAGTAWRGKLPTIFLAEEPFNVAVEVGTGHVTWYRNGNPIGTVRNSRAQLGLRLVPRLSLIGANEEMNGTQVNSDWQRSWTLRSGTQVTNGPALRRGPYSGC